MKVVQIGYTYIQAQKEIEYSIHKALTEAGHQSHILFSLGESNDPNIIKYEYKHEEFIRRFLNKFISRKPDHARFQTKRLIRYLDAFKPDLVNLHTIHHGSIDYPQLFQYLATQKTPVVYTIHDLWPMTGGCYYFTKENCVKYLNGCKECTCRENNFDNARSLSAYYLDLKKNLFKKLSYICTVSVSNWTNSLLAQSFLGEYDNYVIYNGTTALDVSSFSDPVIEDIIKKTDHKIRIACVSGSWTERKGLKTLFRLAELLGNDYCIILAGKMSDEDRWNKPENVFAVGFLNPKQLALLYKISDIHVSASLEETFGMTFIEAAMQGTRSVGFACSAVAEILDSIHGCKTSDFTPEGLIISIQKMMKNGNHKMSEKEILEIRERFSQERMAKQYVELYKSILETNEAIE